MQGKKTKYHKRMTDNDKEVILKLSKEGKTPTEISKEMEGKFSNTAIRLFLNKKKINTSRNIDRSRPCKVCSKVFTPKSYDGVKKDKYVICSNKCRAISNKKKRRSKYSDAQISKVIRLKKEKFTNKEIEKITKVNLNTIKSIIREEKIQLTPEERQNNAYKSKLIKNPKAIQEMREGRMSCPTNVFNIKLNNIKNQLEMSDNKKSIPYLCKERGLNDNSVRVAMHRRGWSHLVGKQISGPEYEILEFIKENIPKKEIIQGDRSILKGREIDIYIPELKLGIEYCGLYWHNENSPTPRDKNYHYEKMKMCESLGIRLITIFEDEWLEREKQVKNYIKSVLGVSSMRIYARKCTINEVDKDVSKNFLEDNHIQGKTTFKVAFGLFYKESLVGLVTSNTHHRQGHSNKNVLNRLVFADGVQVVGGASKLLKYLIKYSKNAGYSHLISWSDNRWSQGNVYSKIGFSFVEELKPDYSYFVGGSKRQSKQSNKKKSLIKKGAIGNMTMTEIELAKTIGYSRIWDCGKKRWEINLHDMVL